MEQKFRLAICLLLLTWLPLSAFGQEPIRFVRTPDISPDGKVVAFSYRGDIWTVEAIGGIARPITMHEAHEFHPCISPDGKQIAFASNRYGSYDVFVTPVLGGRPTRLTFDSATDIPTGWTPDGEGVIFTSNRSPDFPKSQNVYVVPAKGGAVKKLNLFEGKEAAYSPDGERLAFVRGPGVWYRKGYRGSSNDDIWLSRADGSEPKQLTRFDGHDTSPMWSADGKAIFYVTEEGSEPGCANIVCHELNPTEKEPLAVGTPRKITDHKNDSVRLARISGNGEWIIYECGPDIWIVSTRGGSPRKMAIEAHADDKSNTEKLTTFRDKATEYALSPDESHAVLVVHGELFLTRIPDGGKATRLTESPAFDHSPNWAPDGKSIIFTSDRTGTENIYLLEADGDEADLTKAYKFKVRPLTNTRFEESQPKFSPKGDRIAFIRSGQLWTMKPDGTAKELLVKTPKVTGYDWSPDGKYVAFSQMDGSFASELFVVPTDSSAEPINVSRYATYNGDVSWSQKGNRLAFISQRQGTYSVHTLPLVKPSVPGVKPAKDETIDLDDAHLRVSRLASMSAESCAISPDGNMIAFRSNSGRSGDVWIVAANGSNLGRITSGGVNPKQIQWSTKTTGRVYFLTGTGELRHTRASLGGFTGSSGPATEPTKVPFVASMMVRQDEVFAEMFAQSWRALSEQFYDEQFHGANWQAVRDKYAPLVEETALKEDLYALISLMLGELNASHLGISGQTPTPLQNTADLGLLFDESYAGPGLKVAEVISRGPADRRGLDIQPGDLLTSIDRTELDESVNISELLNGKAGERLLVEISREVEGKKVSKELELSAVERSAVSKLLYERWVRGNAARVDELSQGRLGYIHIPSMDDNGLETFVRSLYSDNFDKDGIIIDVRYNGGGFTHEQVLNYLSGREHTVFKQRNGGEGWVLRSPDRKWYKPATVLINNRSYSDAEIFPHAFRVSGIGKVVGQPTGGLVIGTGGMKLIDGSTFRLPRVGVFTTEGVNMEKAGVEPDILVEIQPSDWVSGKDPQIAKAIEVLETDVLAWKRERGLIKLAPEPRLASTAKDKKQGQSDGSASQAENDEESGAADQKSTESAQPAGQK